MSEVGQVIEEKQNYVTVRMTRNEACDKCGACAHGLKSEEMLIEAENLCHAKSGDWVSIDLQHSDFLRAVGIMYGLPLVMLLIGLGAGYGIASILQYSPMKEPLALVVGLAFTAATFLWIRRKEAYWKTKNFHPAAVKIVNDSIE